MTAYLRRCEFWPEGLGRCEAAATCALLAPNGDPTIVYCEPHARATVEEYERVLGERWTLRPVETT